MVAAANTIIVHERPYLLARVGAAAHLVAEAGLAEPGRAIAVHEDHARLNPAYDEADLVDARCVEGLERWGCFMIDGVPPEQMELLRDQVRAECRRRGWRFQSSAMDRRLYASSENSLSAERRALVDRDAWERIRMVDSEVRPSRPSWQFGW